MKSLRARVEAEIERLIELLDQIDGNADDEAEADVDDTPISLQSANRRVARQIRRAA